MIYFNPDFCYTLYVYSLFKIDSDSSVLTTVWPTTDWENATPYTILPTTTSLNSDQKISNSTTLLPKIATIDNDETISSTASTYLSDVEEIDDLEFNSKIDEERAENEEVEEEEEEQYSYPGFTNYIHMVESTLMRNSHKNIKSKTAVLENLRDHLLIDIGNSAGLLSIYLSNNSW